MTIAAQNRELFRHDLRPPVRYNAAAQALHWLTALLMFAILPVAWHMTTMARDNPTRETWYTVHKSLGLTILALAVIRLVIRALNPPPPLPGLMGRLEEGAAVASHWLLYLVLLVMPISGYLISAAGGHAVSYFGLFEIPSFVPESAKVALTAVQVHLLTQWAVYGLIALHLLATAWHLIVRRDDVLARMLPQQDRATS